MSVIRLLSIMTLAVAALGCNAVSFKADRPFGTDPAVADWPFAPVAMRVHPFTALERPEEEGPLVLELRIEMVDQLGDITKGVGDWRFELYTQPGQRPGQRSRERLEVWQASMTELDQNERHYDPITRTYAFRLRVANEPPPEQPLSVVVQFNAADGSRLIAEGEIPYDRPS